MWVGNYTVSIIVGIVGAANGNRVSERRWSSAL